MEVTVCIDPLHWIKIAKMKSCILVDHKSFRLFQPQMTWKHIVMEVWNDTLAAMMKNVSC